MERKILFDEVGLDGKSFVKGQWKEISEHTELNIKGFFGEYRFLGNFWPAKVFLDEDEYSCVENAYQAAKFKKEDRGFFKSCDQKSAIRYAEEYVDKALPKAEWDLKKVGVMRELLRQKFDKNSNPENHQQLIQTGNKYLEETNYWQDVFWGVHRTSKNEDGVGENNLGKLLMEIRDIG